MSEHKKQAAQVNEKLATQKSKLLGISHKLETINNAPVPPKPVHTHAHTIPVEYQQGYYNDNKWIARQGGTRFVVTKLRCVCGDEVERNV